MALVMTSPLGPKPRALGVKKRTIPIAPPYEFPPGTYSWLVPYSGRWKFVAWSGGGSVVSDGDGGTSGCYSEKTKALAANTVVSIVVGTGGVLSTVAEATTITFPDGSVVSCPAGGVGTSVPTPTGGDVNLPGSPAGDTSGTDGTAGQGTGGGAKGRGGGGSHGGGGGAPANLPFRGGDGGGSVSPLRGRTPGGGGYGSALTSVGGDGLVLAFMV